LKDLSVSTGPSVRNTSDFQQFPITLKKGENIMFNKLKVRSNLRVAIEAFAVVLILLGALLLRATPTQAGPAEVSSAAQSPAPANPVAATPAPSSSATGTLNAPQNIGQFDCIPGQVSMDAYQYVAVICANFANTTINFFAWPTADATRASMFLSTFTTAFVMGKHLVIYYFDDTTSGPPFGCQTSNCRKIASAYIQP
jgi:hypothetical protein